MMILPFCRIQAVDCAALLRPDYWLQRLHEDESVNRYCGMDTSGSPFLSVLLACLQLGIMRSIFGFKALVHVLNFAK